MSIHTQPAAIDSVKKSLVALKMPRALEMLDTALRRVEQGEITWIEALDQLLIEELTLRDNRRVSTALRMSRLTTVKTLAGFDFAFQPSLCSLSLADRALRNPITGLLEGCAFAASGQTADPTITLTNSRRLIVSPSDKLS